VIRPRKLTNTKYPQKWYGQTLCLAVPLLKVVRLWPYWPWCHAWGGGGWLPPHNTPISIVFHCSYPFHTREYKVCLNYRLVSNNGEKVFFHLSTAIAKLTSGRPIILGVIMIYERTPEEHRLICLVNCRPYSVRGNGILKAIDPS